LSAVKADAGAILFKPGAAYRVRRSTYSDTPLPVDEPAGENPPDGAVIDYSLPQGISGPVRLEILDASRKLVRTYASTDAPESTQAELEKQLIPLYWPRMPKTLPATPGMHRWLWDLHYTAPTATRYSYPISAVPHDTPREPEGPHALPGTYTVRLTAGGKVLTAPLTVKMDPRVHATAAELATLFAEESKLAGWVTKGASAALQVHSAREQLAALAKTAGQKTAEQAIKEAIEKVDKELGELLSGRKSPAGGEAEPGLDDAAGASAGLYEQVGSSDAAPTAVQVKAAEHADEELAEALKRWERTKATSLPALNRQLEAAHMPTVNLTEMPQDMPDSGDED